MSHYIIRLISGLRPSNKKKSKNNRMWTFAGKLNRLISITISPPHLDCQINQIQNPKRKMKANYGRLSNLNCNREPWWRISSSHSHLSVLGSILGAPKRAERRHPSPQQLTILTLWIWVRKHSRQVWRSKEIILKGEFRTWVQSTSGNSRFHSRPT